MAEVEPSKEGPVGPETPKTRPLPKPGGVVGTTDHCSCGRRHEIVLGRDGRRHVDTGWY